MRSKILFVLLAFAGIATAQDKYSVVLQKAQSLSPYEAIYMLMDYQQDYPQQANVYYQLGNRCYELLQTRNALYNYHEYKELLYRSKLFYGNCLHFAKDQKLAGWQYSEIAKGEKKIEYSQLESYIRPRLKEVARLQTACDSIHDSFYRLVEQYNNCQLRFSQFLTLYTREKTAHLQLTAEQRTELEMLAREAEPLKKLISNYQSALALEPIEGYNPYFRWQPIELYRLDGLTTTNFLQNDVALWDYALWVAHFLHQQKEQYERLYADVEKEYTRLNATMLQYRAGKKISDRIDATLVGRCARLELRTQAVEAIRAMQTMVQLGALEQQITQAQAPKEERELTPVLQLMSNAMNIRKELSDKAYSTTADSAMNLIRAQIIRWAEPLAITQQPVYTSPISGEITRYTPAQGENVYALLPSATGWRCVVIDETNQETRVKELDESLRFIKDLLRAPNEQPLLFTSLPNGRWVLITNTNTHFGIE